MEILSPAGTPEALTAAVRTGADAVYLGGESFSARQNAGFSTAQLEEAVRFCHLHGVKVHLAVNTLLFDSELLDFAKAVESAAKIGVDALIVQDLGALRLIKNIAPEIPLHASTQLSIHTKEGALLAKKLGFSRVVLARELPSETIAEICQLDIETEVFVHGALCMCVSGQCFLSAMMGGRSANRGRCGQACRLPFSAVLGEERADLSLKDLSLVEEVGALQRLGVSSLKIEGRRKRPEYVAAATAAVFAARAGETPNLANLQAVFSRGGFTDGYYANSLGGEMFGTRGREDVVAAVDVLPQLKELYRKEKKSYTIQFVIEVKRDSPVKLTLCQGENISVEIAGDFPQIAQTRPLDLAFAEKQLSRLGDTVFEFGGLSGVIESELMLTAAALNDLRRRGVAALEEKLIVENSPNYTISSWQNDIPFGRNTRNIKPRFRLELTKAEQLAGLDLAEIELLLLPLDEWEKTEPDERICLCPPRFMTDECAMAEQLSAARKKGFSRILCNNPAHIPLGKALGFTLHGGFGLNVTNSQAAAEFARLGLCDITASFELKLPQISALSAPIPVGIIAYGRLPLMLMRNCPIKSAVGSCKNCSGELFDRTGRTFHVSCAGSGKGKTFTELLNSDTLWLADRMSELNTDFVTLKFEEESPLEISQVIEAYRTGEKAEDNFTRGLYYRGVSAE